MNVNLLKDNPDWRWYMLFAGAFLSLSIAGWLLVRYNPVRIISLTSLVILTRNTDRIVGRGQSGPYASNFGLEEDYSENRFEEDLGELASMRASMPSRKGRMTYNYVFCN